VTWNFACFPSVISNRTGANLATAGSETGRERHFHDPRHEISLVRKEWIGPTSRFDPFQPEPTLGVGLRLVAAAGMQNHRASATGLPSEALTRTPVTTPSSSLVTSNSASFSVVFRQSLTAISAL